MHHGRLVHKNGPAPSSVGGALWVGYTFGRPTTSFTIRNIGTNTLLVSFDRGQTSLTVAVGTGFDMEANASEFWVLGSGGDTTFQAVASVAG